MSRRFLLIAAILACEAVVMTGGIFVTEDWVQKALTRSAADQALKDNRIIASQFSGLVDEMHVTQLERGSRNWNRLQSVIENFRLPNGGYLCVIDSKTGGLMFHPDMRSNPSLAGQKVGLNRIVTEASDRPIVEQVTSLSSAAGRVWIQDDIHMVAARRLSNLNANVLAHQPVSALEATASQTASYVYSYGFPVAGCILALTAVGSVLCLRRHESGLQGVNDQLEMKLVDRSKALTNTRNAVIFGLAKLAENRDTDTGEHLDRIREYSTLLARRLQSIGWDISDEFISEIGLASALHDIGKVGIPDAVLLKSGRLTPSERKIIETHPTIGCKCLLSIEKRLGEDKFLQMATEICLTHHEKWDGSGYPLGLVGEKIPLTARIVAVADVYDALTSKRPYKEPLSHEEAHRIVMDGSGTHFDPDIAAAFDSLFSEFKAVHNQCFAKTVPPIVSALTTHSAKIAKSRAVIAPIHHASLIEQTPVR